MIEDRGTILDDLARERAVRAIEGLPQPSDVYLTEHDWNRMAEEFSSLGGDLADSKTVTFMEIRYHRPSTSPRA